MQNVINSFEAHNGVPVLRSAHCNPDIWRDIPDPALGQIRGPLGSNHRVVLAVLHCRATRTAFGVATSGGGKGEAGVMDLAAVGSGMPPVNFSRGAIKGKRVKFGIDAGFTALDVVSGDIVTTYFEDTGMLSLLLQELEGKSLVGNVLSLPNVELKYVCRGGIGLTIPRRGTYIVQRDEGSQIEEDLKIEIGNRRAVKEYWGCMRLSTLRPVENSIAVMVFEGQFANRHVPRNRIKCYDACVRRECDGLSEITANADGVSTGRFKCVTCLTAEMPPGITLLKKRQAVAITIPVVVTQPGSKLELLCRFSGFSVMAELLNIARGDLMDGLWPVTPQRVSQRLGEVMGRGQEIKVWGWAWQSIKDVEDELWKGEAKLEYAERAEGVVHVFRVQLMNGKQK